MGEKCLKNGRPRALSIGCCDMTVKCRFRWRWNHALCCSCYRGPMQNSSCPLSLTFVYFAFSFVLFAALGIVFAWLTISPFSQPVFETRELSCQSDNEGSWSIGLFYGDNPMALQPIEQLNLRNDRSSAWPVANPVLTCASVTDSSHPSTFVGDPFLFIQDTTFYIFFETKNSLTKQGDIGVAASSDRGASWEYLGIALDEEWHLSFPYVFSHEGQVFMMPESSEKGDLRLYRALNFPLQWTLERILVKRPLVDAAMVQYNGDFWIFASDFHRFGAQKNGEFELWYASTPLGPWKQHRGNPLHNGDPGLGARNGGRPFVFNGQLYRVGQDCGKTYGHKIRLFRVETLTKNKYREVEVSAGFQESRKGRNSWNGVRFHHLDAQELPTGGWIAVMDGDRVPSGDLGRRCLVGTAAFMSLVLIVLLFGIVVGVVQCVLPLSKCFNTGKRSGMPPLWAQRQMTSTVHWAFSRLNRGSSALKSRVKPNSAARAILMFFCFTMGVVLVCIGVRSFFGGNGAEEPYPVEGGYSQFTMVTMTYEERLWNLKMYIRHYSRCASVREIVVVWNKGQPPNPDTDFDSAVPVHIRVENINSLNNRFRPDPHIKTRAVLQLDDDILMTCDDLERAFKAWRNHPERIVGFYPRLNDGSPLKYRNERHARAKNGYNMILTGAAFIDSELAFPKYWSPEADQGRALVDDLFNCEDILMNFIVANATTARTVEYIHPAWAIDTSKLSSSAISRDTKVHYMKRTNCLRKFTELYKGLSLKKWEFGSRADVWDF